MEVGRGEVRVQRVPDNPTWSSDFIQLAMAMGS